MRLERLSSRSSGACGGGHNRLVGCCARRGRSLPQIVMGRRHDGNMAMAANQAAPFGAILTEPARRCSGGHAIAFLLLLGTSYMFNAMDRQVFPALLVAINSEYRLSLAQGGLASTIFTVNVALFAALSGWFMGRFGRRRVLFGGLIAYSVFTLLTPFATGFLSLVTLRTLTGAGEALQVGAVFACIGGYFGARRGAAMGAMQTFFGLGAFLGPMFGTQSEVWTGSWRSPFFVYGFAGMVIAVLAAAVLPREFTEATEIMEPHPNQNHRSGPVLCRNVILGAGAFGVMGTAFFSYSSLYATYLHTALGFTSVSAGSALGMYGIGAMCAVVGGWLGDKVNNNSAGVVLLLLATVGYMLFRGFEQLWPHLVLSFTFGLMVSGFLFARLMSLVQRSVQPTQIGYAGAVALAAFYLPGTFVGFLFGKLVETVGWSTASLFMVVAPPILGFVLMIFYDHSKVENN
jgi:DHA1 family inner membrane transport protein